MFDKVAGFPIEVFGNDDGVEVQIIIDEMMRYKVMDVCQILTFHSVKIPTGFPLQTKSLSVLTHLPSRACRKLYANRGKITGM